jgi:hypothetical protein
LTNRKSQNSILFLTIFIWVAVSTCVGQSSKEIELNRRPIIDFGEWVKARLDQGRVNLDGPFVFEAKGQLDKSGKIVPSTFKITRSEGDAGTVEIVKNAISAVNDAGYFQYLRDIGVTDVTIQLKQDSSLFSTQVSSEMMNETRPKTIKSMIDVMTQLSIQKKEGAQPISDSDKCDLLFLKGLSTSVSDRTFTLKLELPKDTIRDMLMSRLSIK